MSQQPEALELISLFELESDPESLYRRAATELRRLHAVESGAKVELMRRDNLIDSLQGLCESYRTQVESLRVEVNEQARLNGMGAERELALMAKVEILQAASVEWSPAYTRGPARQSAPVAAVPEEVLPPHTEWRRGDKLRVIRSRAGDPFELGQIVTHADVDGDFAPYCSAHRVGKWAIDATRLEFVSHGITSGDGGEV